MQEQRIHHAEDRRVGSDPQSQRQHHDDCKAWIFTQRPRRVAQVLQRGFQQRKSAALAINFFGRLDTAELQERLPARLLSAHSRAKVVFDVHLQMAFHLRGEFLIAPLFAK